MCAVSALGDQHLYGHRRTAAVAHRALYIEHYTSRITHRELHIESYTSSITHRVLHLARLHRREERLQEEWLTIVASITEIN